MLFVNFCNLCLKKKKKKTFIGSTPPHHQQIIKSYHHQSSYIFIGRYVAAIVARWMSTETESVVAGIKKSGLFQTNGFIGGKWIDAFDGNTIEVPAVSNSVVVDGDDAAEMLFSQNKHAAIQKQVVGASLAVEGFARRCESGD